MSGPQAWEGRDHGAFRRTRGQARTGGSRPGPSSRPPSAPRRRRPSWSRPSNGFTTWPTKCAVNWATRPASSGCPTRPVVPSSSPVEVIGRLPLSRSPHRPSSIRGACTGSSGVRRPGGGAHRHPGSRVVLFTLSRALPVGPRTALFTVAGNELGLSVRAIKGPFLTPDPQLAGRSGANLQRARGRPGSPLESGRRRWPSNLGGMGSQALPPVTVGELVTRWQFAPFVTVFAVVAAGLYLWGALRVRRRHPARPWPLRRTALFLAGWPLW